MGNAIISRFEILQADRYALPPQGLPIERGWLEATIDLGENNSISIIATHFHHVEEDSTIRQQQAEVLLDHWNNRSGSIILGDLNAIPVQLK
jgi:endonuclease/exonuclease/phosphatase family metal-dependent hydrolase